MTDAKESTTPRRDPKLDEQELHDAEALPGIVANRFLIASTRNGIRIAFGEQPRTTSPTHMRAAVFINAEDAAALGKLLLKHFAPKAEGQEEPQGE